MWKLARNLLTRSTSANGLTARQQPICPPPEHHYITGRSLVEPYPEGMLQATLGMGCFWGAERRFWQQPGVWVTAVGYAGGQAPNPTYDEVCTGRTGHAEVVRVVFDPRETSYGELLKVFWESHNPTQGMCQGNDRGTQYRSVLYTHGPEQAAEAQASKAAYETALRRSGLGRITTEMRPAPPFHLAEDYHQQYLAKHPGGYCGLGGTGVSCPIAHLAASEHAQL
jgi:peptide-methionine (S)-S-oxide reductase